MIDFPANPTTNQIFTSGGVQWIWDGTKWVANGVGTGYVPLSGGTMTGPLILNADPTVALGAATKQQADARTPGENRIINGDMRIDQRNGGASGATTNVYTVDRWFYGSSQTAKGTWQRSASGPVPLGFPYALEFQSSSAYVSISTDEFDFQQRLEGDAISDFAWGTASAQSVTLSFLVYSSLAGTFSGSLRNMAGTRSFPFTYPLVANTWTKIIIPIFGDPNGTWVMSGNTGALVVSFDLGSGSTLRGPANVWASANYIGVTGTASIVGINGATFFLTGVKLEIGSIASRFVRKSTAEALADCQRYYQILQSTLVTGYQTAGGQVYTCGTFQTAMRANPTVVFSGISYSNAGNLINGSISPFNFYNAISIIATGQGYALHNVAFSAEL
jgi:hypothetical protein